MENSPVDVVLGSPMTRPSTGRGRVAVLVDLLDRAVETDGVSMQFSVVILNPPYH